MYLITEHQFYDVNQQEGPSWYDLTLELGYIDRVPVRTFTHSSVFSRSLPNDKYLKVIMNGLKEAYPGLSEKEIKEYLNCAMNIK